MVGKPAHICFVSHLLWRVNVSVFPRLWGKDLGIIFGFLAGFFFFFWPPRQHVEFPPTKDGKPHRVLTTGLPRKSVIFGFDELYPRQPAEGSTAFQRGQSETY